MWVIPGGPVVKPEDNHELISEGYEIISNVIKNEYNKYYPEEIVDAVHRFLTTDELLGLVGKHIGLTDLIQTNVITLIIVCNFIYYLIFLGIPSWNNNN